MLEHPTNRAISSQAAQECVEGSTTSAWSPERAVKHHERAATKLCLNCREEKTLAEFSKGRSKCKLCRVKQEMARYFNPENHKTIRERRKAFYAAKTDHVTKQLADSYRRHRERRLKAVLDHQAKPEVVAQRLRYNAERYEQKKALIRGQQREYQKNNPSVFAMRDARRRAAELRALAKWADPTKIREVYDLAETLTKTTGVKHVVDHIVPLQGRNVCGLHVETNLQAIPYKDNLKKSNKHNG